jgi:hypothetical protein
MSASDEPQQHSTVYRSYQSFRFPFAANDEGSSAAEAPREVNTPPAPPPPARQSVPPIKEFSDAGLFIPTIESAESSPRQSSFHQDPVPAAPQLPTPQPTAPPAGGDGESLQRATSEDPGNSPRGILVDSSVSRSNENSPRVNRAPPRALPRRASMVSFRLQRSGSVSGSAAPTPREFSQSAEAQDVERALPSTTADPSPVAPVADPTPSESRGIVLPEALQQSTPPVSSSQLGGSFSLTSPSVRPVDTPPLMRSVETPPSPPAVPNNSLAPSVVYASAPTRTPSVESAPTAPVAVATPRQVPSPKSIVQPAATLTPREPSSGVPTPRSAASGTPMNRTESPSIAPVVPKRAAPQLVAKFQSVVRQKLEQERKANQEEEQRKKDEEQKRKEEERAKKAEADEKKMELLLELQRAHDDQLKHIEDKKAELEFHRQIVAAERDALENERREFEKEKAALVSTINSERSAIQQEWYALSVEVELLQKRKELLESNGAPSGQNWRGDQTVITSPSRDDFKRIDPMVLRDLLQHSPHGGAFAYEAPEQLPRLVATSRAASSSVTRDVKFSEDELSRAEALHRFERWRDPIRFKQDGRGSSITQQVHHLQDGASPLRIEYHAAAAKVSPNHESLKRSPHSMAPIADSHSAADEYMEVTTTTPNFRLFPRKGRM